MIADPTPGEHRTDSDDIAWWLPILGRTATWLAHLLARHARHQAETVWDTDTLARVLGLSGNQMKLWASLDRVDQFGAARFLTDDTCTIRLWLPGSASVTSTGSPTSSPPPTATASVNLAWDPRV